MIAVDLLKEELFELKNNDIVLHSYIPTRISNLESAIKELETLENRSCQNCSTHPSNCRIFYGANKQLALSVETFNCSLWEAKK